MQSAVSQVVKRWQSLYFCFIVPLPGVRIKFPIKYHRQFERHADFRSTLTSTYKSVTIRTSSWTDARKEVMNKECPPTDIIGLPDHIAALFNRFNKFLSTIACVLLLYFSSLYFNSSSYAIYRSFQLSIYQFFSIYQPIILSIHKFIDLPISNFTIFRICQFIHPSIYHSIHKLF